MGEAVLGALLPVLLDKLAQREVFQYFRRLKGVNKTVMEKWTRMLTAIEAVLSDAEEKQLTQRGVKLWLDDLRDLAYDIEDILDTFATKVLKRRIERQHGRKRKYSWISSLCRAKFNLSLNSEIQKISDRLEEITARENKLGLNKLGVSKKPWKMPPTTYQLDEPVIGRDEAKAKILDDVLYKGEHSTNNFHNFCVVSIVGTGGLGKTTLAKDVFNDAATEQFLPKGWVSVSDDFDLLRVTTAVLESVTSRSAKEIKESKELNSVLQMLQR
ncbi:hypothetical protein ACLB2K_075056 [Fragaria x ananassa]